MCWVAHASSFQPETVSFILTFLGLLTLIFRILDIDSWKKGFEYAFREENRLLFNRMLTKCLENGEYSKAVEARGECYSAEESLFMALILQQQQKMISQLINRLAKTNADGKTKFLVI
jgi:hypothetical protein